MPNTGIKSKLPSIGLGIGLALIAAVIVAVIVVLVYLYNKPSEVSFKITDKESVVVSNGDNTGSKNEYRVYTSNGTYKVTDSLPHFRFNSADVYGKLVVNNFYKCKVFGVRLPFFSGFKNILSCEDVTGQPSPATIS